MSALLKASGNSPRDKSLLKIIDRGSAMLLDTFLRILLEMELTV